MIQPIVTQPFPSSMQIHGASIYTTQGSGRNLSDTDYKTYCFVVLRDLLIATGFVLGCASFVLAVAVNPALVCTIVPAVALAILGIHLSPTASFWGGHGTKPQEYIPRQPIGLYNENKVNCWANASLQVFAHTALGRRVQAVSEELIYELSGLTTALDAYETARAEASPASPCFWLSPAKYNSQELRVWLYDATRSEKCRHQTAEGAITSKEANKQEEAASFFRYVLSAIGYQLPLQQRVLRTPTTDRAPPHKEGVESMTNLTDATYLTFFHRSGLTFADLCREYFHVQADDQSEGFDYTINTGKYFTAAPPFFVLECNRLNGSYDRTAGRVQAKKAHDPIDFPPIWRLTEEQCPSEQATYDCTGLVVHSGGADGGHYTAYVQWEGRHWFLNDDSYPRVITPDAYREAMKQGVVFVYEKRGPLSLSSS